MILNNIIQFSGNFVFQMPGYNNDPQDDATTDPNAKYNRQLKSDQVFDICGSDPSRYFEFIFRNVKINQVTYSDGTFVTDQKKDSIIGQKILLYGLMVDVSASNLCTVIRFNIKRGNLLAGKIQTAIQSELRTNIRPKDVSNPFSSENAGAHFETIIDLSDKSDTEESRFLYELGDINQLEFYMHLNRYTLWKEGSEENSSDELNGDVYGYISELFIY